MTLFLVLIALATVAGSFYAGARYGRKAATFAAKQFEGDRPPHK